MIVMVRASPVIEYVIGGFVLVALVILIAFVISIMSVVKYTDDHPFDEHWE
jgi:CHASE3 domain sensor protein